MLASVFFCAIFLKKIKIKRRIGIARKKTDVTMPSRLRSGKWKFWLKGCCR